MSDYEVIVEWYQQRKTEETGGEKTVPRPVCPPQIPDGLTGDWTLGLGWHVKVKVKVKFTI